MKWTKEEERILTELYQTDNVFAPEIAEILGRSVRQVYCKARAMGLKVSKQKLINASNKGGFHEISIQYRFKMGHTPANKGKKMSPEHYAKAAPTMFKKGQVPENKRKVGEERVNVDGYIEIKVAEPNKWRLKHRVVWEQHNGPIPPGCNIQFKNHDSLDCRIENLYMITKADQMRNENSLVAKYPKPLQDVIRLKGVINRKIHKTIKENEKQ